MKRIALIFIIVAALGILGLDLLKISQAGEEEFAAKATNKLQRVIENQQTILKNQQTILQRFDEQKKELHIIKIRASKK